MKLCKAIRALLLIVAGAELFANVAVAGLTGLQVAGLLFALSGVVKLVHALGFCSACSSCCAEPEKKKK